MAKTLMLSWNLKNGRRLTKTGLGNACMQ